ncbi:MAG: arginine--tRNA ligase, partial [Candidatus Cloacimonadota bacterium]
MIKEILRTHINAALDKLNYLRPRDFIVEVPNNTEFGDYSTNAALVLGKANKLAPAEMAKALIKEL